MTQPFELPAIAELVISVCVPNKKVHWKTLQNPVIRANRKKNFLDIRPF